MPPQQDAVVVPIHEDGMDGPVEPNLMSDANVNEPIINDEGMDVGLLAQIAIEHIKFGVHVAEVFSPPRVTALADKVNLSAGFALDLTQVDAETGKPWNFSDPEMRDKAWKLQGEQKPFLLIGCSPCCGFSTLFSSNASRMKPQVRRHIIREGLIHIKFCIQMYNRQINENI